MLTKIMKWCSAAVLIPALFGLSSEGYIVALQLVVTAGAVLLVWEGFHSNRQIWAVGFSVIAAAYNPFQPLLFSRGTLFLLSAISIATFLASLVMMRSVAKTPMLSVVD